MANKHIPELFGSMVFNEEVMRAHLPKEVYKSLMTTIETGTEIDPSIADVVASAMKDWAVEKGATHYTHWFQPLTGVTAEKHDAFINSVGQCKVVMEFSGKELIRGESDASSFPSGGLRATFEARGYTAWDPASYAFVKDGTLYIPTAYCSYTGEALDTKTPLLRSMDVLNRQALRILRLFGDTTTRRVSVTVGAEQEYFLVNKDYYDRRKDLIYCGRTLFGASAPKGQEMDDHYFGPLKPKIAAFMQELDEELWKLGIEAKTKHNEAAPSQHELAPIFATSNLAVDQNLLTMEYIKKVAERHGLAALLSEKPYAGVNGSGKHNNWSLATDAGKNLLRPGKTPSENVQFLLFLASILCAVDRYQDLMRLSVASASNDHRLGAGEAPPSVVSVFVGEELSAIFDSIINGKAYKDKSKDKMNLHIPSIPVFNKDTTDRNRTSPFAFTGNKFEFRMVGSSQNIAMPNVILNTAIAEVLKEFADQLEGSSNFDADVRTVIRETLTAHQRIVFDGNGYSEEWRHEAERRGLSSYPTCVDVYPTLLSQKNIRLFTSMGVMSETELNAREAILLENYSKAINIEAQTMIVIANRQIIPAVEKYIRDLAETVRAKREAFGEQIDCYVEQDLLNKIIKLQTKSYKALEALKTAETKAVGSGLKLAAYYKDRVLPAMAQLREPIDELETLMPSEYWPLPTYGEMMFNQ
ncbi:MAG: glutamine synthetase III [Clostridia bacterium]|nr:glutamine synthetase III [Clostridia bacterium]